jgi:hypothetical protein
MLILFIIKIKINLAISILMFFIKCSDIKAVYLIYIQVIFEYIKSNFFKSKAAYTL